MQFRNCTPGDIMAAIAQANREHGYELYWEGGPYSLRGRILPESSRVKGARRSWSGRRTKSTCWHGFRDVFIAFFDACPDARVTTAMADYRGKASFYRLYQDTADINIGSVMQPVTMPELCECEDNIPPTAREHREQFEALIRPPVQAHSRTQAIDDEFGWDDAHTVRY